MKKIMYVPLVALFAVSLKTSYALEMTETTERYNYRSSENVQYRTEPAVVYRTEPAVVEKTTQTETKTKTETSNEPDGVVSGTAKAVGQIVAAPFRFVAGVIDLIF